MKACFKCSFDNLFLRQLCEKCGHDLTTDTKQTRLQADNSMPVQELLNQGDTQYLNVGYSLHFWDSLLSVEPILAGPEMYRVFSENLTRADFASTFDLYRKIKQILCDFKPIMIGLEIEDYFEILQSVDVVFELMVTDNESTD
jgi:hypothetical protein